jgi:putative flippase GtrA
VGYVLAWVMYHTGWVICLGGLCTRVGYVLVWVMYLCELSTVPGGLCTQVFYYILYKLYIFGDVSTHRLNKLQVHVLISVKAYTSYCIHLLCIYVSKIPVCLINSVHVSHMHYELAHALQNAIF